MMQAVKRFDPERGFRLATYAMWWIRAAIQEYILHSWSLVKMGTTAAQKKLFFNLRKLKGQLQAIEEGDLHARERDQDRRGACACPRRTWSSMNRRLASPDHSLNAPLRAEGEGEWQDWLVDETRPTRRRAWPSARSWPTASELLAEAMKSLNERERHILTERRLKRRADDARGAVARNTASAASACARSRCAPSRSCRRRCATRRSSSASSPTAWRDRLSSRQPISITRHARA